MKRGGVWAPEWRGCVTPSFLPAWHKECQKAHYWAELLGHLPFFPLLETTATSGASSRCLRPPLLNSQSSVMAAELPTETAPSTWESTPDAAIFISQRDHLDNLYPSKANSLKSGSSKCTQAPKTSSTNTCGAHDSKSPPYSPVTRSPMK